MQQPTSVPTASKVYDRHAAVKNRFIDGGSAGGRWGTLMLSPLRCHRKSVQWPLAESYYLAACSEQRTGICCVIAHIATIFLVPEKQGPSAMRWEPTRRVRGQSPTRRCRCLQN